MKEGNIYFEDTGYCGIFDIRFELIWCDNAPLFKRIMNNRDKLIAYYSTSSIASNSEFIIKYNKKFYCATLYIVKNDFILCRVFPEASREKLYTEINDQIESISYSALYFMNCISSISQSIKNNDMRFIPDYLSGEQQEAESIYTECVNIKNKLVLKTAPEYVHIHELLINTMSKVESMTYELRKKVYCAINIEYLYVKIDYTAFEKAIYNLMKLFFKCGDGDAEVEYSADDPKTLRVVCKFRCTETGASQCEVELRGVSSVFSALGGETNLDICNKKAEFTGLLPVNATSSRQEIEKYNKVYDKYALYDSDMIFGKVIKDKTPVMFRSNVREIEITGGEHDYGDIIFKSVTGKID